MTGCQGKAELYAVYPRKGDAMNFPHDLITSEAECAALKKAIREKFPFFDEKALDSARFIFGHLADGIIWHEGEVTIDCIVKTQSRGIPQGQRNSTMSHFAGRVVKRYGATEKAHGIFLEEAAKCDPPLEDGELDAIWQSACKFARKVQAQDGYVEPEEYNDEFCRESLKPADYSDIGQAKVLAKEYGIELRYTSATDYLRFGGQYWIESKQQAVGAMEEFLDLQLEDAKDELQASMKALSDSGVKESDIRSGGKTLEKQVGADSMGAYLAYLSAKAYHAFVMKRRDMKYVVSALQAAKPMLEVSPADLDKDAYSLNCPDGTYDLRKGLAGRRDHDPGDLITKITAFAPGDEGKQLWLDCINMIFRNDGALIDYVQQIAGISAIGMVNLEALIISYGEGSNGKSTFWNAVSGALGTYSGNISADTLTVGCKRNVKPELAEAKGKRLLIAAELEEGMRLNTSVIKQLCSTDEIFAEKKSTDHLQMPELINSRYTVYLSEKEDSHYADLKKDLVLQLPDGDITAANAASLSGKLSQMANGAVYTDAGETVAIHERKLDALEDIIEAANGKPVLVAYWFRHDMERITERLQKLKIPCSRLDTDSSIRKWNAGEIPVALIHPASAGHGLNLQSGGNTLVWFGLTWSLELYQQTVARLWRQGQASETVVVQHIITKGTIDERIMKALSEKDTTQAALIDAVKADLKI